MLEKILHQLIGSFYRYNNVSYIKSDAEFLPSTVFFITAPIPENPFLPTWHVPPIGLRDTCLEVKKLSESGVIWQNPKTNSWNLKIGGLGRCFSLSSWWVFSFIVGFYGRLVGKYTIHGPVMGMEALSQLAILKRISKIIDQYLTRWSCSGLQLNSCLLDRRCITSYMTI